jgi:hypothetical protein
VPAGAAPSPNDGGQVAGSPAFAAPADALRAFVTALPYIAQWGHVEMRLPDGSITYGTKGPAAQMWVTVVHVTHGADGWAVDSWDASGC